MDAMNDQQVAHKKITRQRASLSCQDCRRRKIKCDKVRPVCGNCMKNGQFCAYGSVLSPRLHSTTGNGLSTPHIDNVDAMMADERAPKRRRGLESDDVSCGFNTPALDRTKVSEEVPVSAPSSIRGSPIDLETKLDRLTSMVERALRKNPQSSKMAKKEGEKSVLRNRTIKGVLPSSIPLSQPSSYQVTGDPRSARSLEPSDEKDDSLSDGGESTPETDIMNDLSMAHLSVTNGGRSRYVGGTYWASVADEVAELSRLLKEEAIFQPITDNLKPRAYHLGESSSAKAKIPDIEGGDSQCQSPMMNQFYSEPELIDKSILFRPIGSQEPAHFAVLHEGLLEDLPSKTQCNLLYRCYVSGVHSSAPLAHLPTMLHWYEDFWSWFEHRTTSRIPFPNPSFIPLLFAILYGGAVSCSAKILSAEIGDKMSVTCRLHNRVNQSLSMLSFVESPSIPALIAFCIIQTLSLKEEEPLRARIFVNVAVQAAVSMGIHREPSKFGISPADAETRRRLWWHIVNIDILASNCTGWPLLVMPESYWDVENVCELRDSLIGTRAGEKYLEAVRNGNQKPDCPDDPLQDTKSHVSLPLVVARGKFAAAGYIRKMIRILLGVKPIGNKEFQSLKRLMFDYDRELEECKARIPALNITSNPGYIETSDDKVSGSPRTPIKHYKGIIPDASIHSQIDYHRSTWVAYHKWAKCQLELMIHKAHCIVYQICIKNARLWGEQRECILEHCHAYMRNYIAVSLDPDFNPFIWGWPSTGYQQPLHAMILMLIDLYRKPFSPEAAQSRFYVDQCFLLSEPDGGLRLQEDTVSTKRPMIEGGRQAWTFLRRLRWRTWRTAGLDPDVLWTKDPETYKEGLRPDGDGTNSIHDQGIYAVPEGKQSYTSTLNHGKQPQWPPSANIFTNTKFPPSVPVDPNSEGAYTLSNTSTSTIPADKLAFPTTLDNFHTSQDLDWSEWDAIFGQYAPLDEEAVGMENGNSWQL